MHGDSENSSRLACHESDDKDHGHSDIAEDYNEAPLVRGLAADGTISVSRDGWTILNKYTGFITYIGIVSTVSPMIEKILLLRNY